MIPYGFTLLFTAATFRRCAQPVSNIISIPEISKSDSVTLRDFRSENEKTGKIFSLFITSDAYVINRERGDILDPSMPRILQHRVYEKFGTSATTLELTVYHMVVYGNI